MHLNPSFQTFLTHSTFWFSFHYFCFLFRYRVLDASDYLSAFERMTNSYVSYSHFIALWHKRFDASLLTGGWFLRIHLHERLAILLKLILSYWCDSCEGIFGYCLRNEVLLLLWHCISQHSIRKTTWV